MHATVKYVGTNKYNEKVFEIIYGKYKFIFVLSKNRLENCRKILKIISEILSHEFGFYFEIEQLEFTPESYMLILPIEEEKRSFAIIECSSINLNVNSTEDLEKSINKAIEYSIDTVKRILKYL